MPVLTPEEYRKRASEIYDPSYAVKVANENNAYNNNLAQLNTQQGNINSQFDTAVAGIQRNTAQTQNQYSNNTLSRGLGRSTIASTGIAGIANTGTRLTAEAEQDRTQKISDLETLKTNLRSSLESNLKALSAEREGGINNMAMQLQQRDQDIQRQMDSAAEEKRRYDENMAWEKQKFNIQQSNSGGSGSGGRNNDTYNQVWANIQAATKDRNGQQYLRDNEPMFRQLGLTDAQINALKKYVDEYYYTPDENKQYTAKTKNLRPMTEGL